jgi:monoamine oxidase
MLLEAKGHEVSLFEARDRSGGRLHTAPSGFEEGAEWVDEDHDRMRGIMRELGVAEVAAPEGEYLLQFQGRQCTEGALWEAAANDLARFEARASRDPKGETIGELVDATCESEEGRWLVSANIRTDEGDEPGRLGLEPWLQFRRMYSLREGREASAYRLEGGGSEFAKRMLSRITAEPRFGSRLLGVKHGGGVRLAFDGFDVTADAAILALPVPCLLEIESDPPLNRIEEIRKLGFAPAVKARFHFEDPFWQREGWSGYMKSDLLIQQTWPDREKENALVGYIVGDAARTLADDERIESTLGDEWGDFGAGVKPTQIEVKNWTRDPFARGAFSLALPGSNPSAIRVREGGAIQLAGEFCATWMGFMEGALESAETAVSALS